MNEISSDLKRRTFFLAGGAGILALAGFARGAEAEPLAATEMANVKVVTDFCNSWNDVDKSATLLAPDSAVRISDDAPVLTGPAAFVKYSKDYKSQAPGLKISVKILHIFAKGPVVVTERIDTMATTGKPANVMNVVGVFIVKNGLIKEWTDYIQA